VHILNVSFLVPRMRREFGGCAGNIAYNLKLLGDRRSRWHGRPGLRPVSRASGGRGIDLSHVLVIDDLFTPQASSPPT
jgi:adenosine kinase